MIDDPKNNYLDRAWRLLGPVALTLVVAMTGTYFVFLQNMVTKEEAGRQYVDIKHSITEVKQDLKRIEATQNQRTASVTDVPALRQELTRLVAEMRATEVRLEDLKARILQVEDVLRKRPNASLLEAYGTSKRPSHEDISGPYEGHHP